MRTSATRKLIGANSEPVPEEGLALLNDVVFPNKAKLSDEAKSKAFGNPPMNEVDNTP